MSVHASKSLNMKTTIAAAPVVLLTFWIGYNRGYHHGAQSERQAWELSVLRTTSSITLDNESAHVFQPSLYRNPHVGQVVMSSQGQMPVGVLEPRNHPVK